MYTMATMHLAMRWFYARWAFITKGGTDEARYHALIDWMTTGANFAWALMINEIAAGINILVADCVIVCFPLAPLKRRVSTELKFVLDLEVLDYLG